jgi:hypothetical protein
VRRAAMHFTFYASPLLILHFQQQLLIDSDRSAARSHLCVETTSKQYVILRIKSRAETQGISFNAHSAFDTVAMVCLHRALGNNKFKNVCPIKKQSRNANIFQLCALLNKKLQADFQLN